MLISTQLLTSSPKAVTAAPTSPSSTSLYGWYSSDQAYTETSGTPTTLITTDNTSVGSMLDRSGNGNHVYQVGGIRPVFHTNVINTLPSILYDGAIQYMATTNGGPTGNSFSMYVVANRNAAQFSGLVGNDDAGLTPRYLIHDGVGAGDIFANNGSNTTAATFTVNTFHLVAVTIDNTGSFPANLQIDNATVISNNLTGGGNLGNLTFGRFFNRFWPGNITEVIFYTTVHSSFSSGDGLIARRYLNNRYNLGLGI